MIPAATQRFTGRAESYRRYRPGYPPAVIELLRRDCALAEGSTVADIAAGTGIFTEMLLGVGFAVSAVEPNSEMRAACAALENRYRRLRVVDGTAEATGLAENSQSLVTVAQAMHWFDLERARREFVRILQPGGWCAVLYNNRPSGGNDFHRAYEQFLLDYGIDYVSVKRQHVGGKRLAQFFEPAAMRCATFPNSQLLNFEGLEGRLLSSSYIPQPGHPGFEAMRNGARQMFEEHQENGAVTLEYECVVGYGQLK